MSERAKIAAEQYGRGLYALRNGPSPQSAFEEGYEQAERDIAKVDSEMPIGLIWGEHSRNGGTHTEWYAPCGCAFHPEPFPHVHPCSDEHKRADLHVGRLATREDADRFIQRELSSAQWLDEKLMISFEKESLIHALVEKWEFEMEPTRD